MLHHRGAYHAGPYCEGARGFIGSKKLDAQADARRFSEGADSPKPPQDQGAHFRSHATDAAPTESMLSNTSRLMKVCGEPVSRSATKLKARYLRGEKGVVESNGTDDEAGAVF